MRKTILIILVIVLLALFLASCTGYAVTYTHQPPKTQYCCYGRTAIPYSIPDSSYQRDMAIMCQQYGGTVLPC